VRRSIFPVVATAVALTAVACTSMRVGSDYDREASFASVGTYDWVGPPDADDENLAAVDRINPFMDRRLRRAVDNELEARGLVRVQEGPVDLLVAVDVLDAQRVGEVRRASTATPVFFSVGFGFNPGWYSPWGWGGYPFWGYSRYGWGGRYGWGHPWGWGWGGSSLGRVGVGFGYRTPYFGWPSTSVSFGVGQSWGGYGLREPGLPPGSFVIDIIDGTTGDLVWRGWAEGAVYYAPDVEDLPEFIASTVHRIMEGFPADVTRGAGRSAG